MKKIKQTTSEIVTEALIVMGGIALALTLCRCTPPLNANDAYKAELAACVATGKTRTEVDACRKAVNAKYAVCEQPGQWPRYTPCPK